MNVVEEKIIANIKPFLRWAGGKSWLTKHICQFLPKNYERYHEPFLGSGAIYFYLKPTSKRYLSDLNNELINTYIRIRDDVTQVIKELKTYKNSKEFYYDLRNKKLRVSYKQAARFIYSNKALFNGIYRVNSQAKYNGSYGYRKDLCIDENSFLLASNYLANSEITAGDFELA